MKLSLFLLTSTIFFTSCSESETNEEVVIKNCSSIIVERYSHLDGFRIMNIKTSKANEVKLALGIYDKDTEFIVSVDFSTDSLKGQSCTCLMRKDGSFIVTTDKIQFE